MKLIGYWIRSLRDTEYYPPQEFVSASSPELQSMVAEYLDKGIEFKAYRGVSWCRFYCGYDRMGHRELSDGHFVWPEGLSHYVRDHAVRLPNEFIAHVQSATQPIPEKHWNSTLDEAYWKEWCRTHASEKFRTRLQVALSEADVLAELKLAQAAVEIEAREGLGDSKCHWYQCTNRALTRRALCGRCMIKGSEDMYVYSVYSDLRSVLASASEMPTIGTLIGANLR